MTSPWSARSRHGCRQHCKFCTQYAWNVLVLYPEAEQLCCFTNQATSSTGQRRGATVTTTPRGSTAALQSRQLCCLRIKRRHPPARSNSHDANGLFCVIRVMPPAIGTDSTTCAENMQSVQSAKHASGEQHYMQTQHLALPQYDVAMLRE